ncbi:MAG: M20 family metallopeptidase [Chloroflexota bacterium]|nr:M20 family metallopeptidase [Chloroflexota bacterium]
MNLQVKELKVRVTEAVESQKRFLVQLSQNIHGNPELGFQEKKASTWLGAYLEENGFYMEKGIAGLATAFRATYGQSNPRIALLAEYDALPKIGHACGHNIIAASAVGASVAGKLAVDTFGGSIIVLGTPAEEVFGGKIDMVNEGVFREIDIAMMIHPSTRNIVIAETLACISLDVEFWGKTAHAAAQPHQGINALEALILSFNSINSLRQHIKEEVRIHGIITDGGQVPNVVPDHSAAKFLIRAQDITYLEELKEKVLNCFLGASIATGAGLEYSWGKRFYAPMKNNLTLAKLFRQNLESLNRRVELFDPHFSLGSTDMGNVSQIVPSIHPLVSITSSPIPLHTPEFASAAVSEEGYRGLMDAAKAMSMTVVDILAFRKTLDEIKQEFSHS